METAGYGTTIGYADTLGGSYTLIAEVVEITPPEIEVGDIETTHLASTNKVRTYQGGLIEPGEVEMSIHFDKAIFATLLALRGTDKFYKVTFADGSTWAGPGYLKKIGAETPIDDIVAVPIGVKCSGDWTFTAAS